MLANKTKKCIMCGNVMQNVGNNRMYCDDCVKLSPWKKKAARRKRETPHGKKHKPESIESIVQKASAEGLSYGQYMAKHGGAENAVD